MIQTYSAQFFFFVCLVFLGKLRKLRKVKVKSGTSSPVAFCVDCKVRRLFINC